MSINVRLWLFPCALLLCAAACSAQETRLRTQSAGAKIDLDVVVTPKSGPPVADLQQQDFTLLDNKVPQPITSFRAVSGREALLRVILVIDAVNSNAENLGYERLQLDKFLRVDGGRLAYPTALAVFTDKGTQTSANPSTDGNLLSAALQQDEIGLGSIRRSAGGYGDEERFHLSLDSLRQLVASEAPRPGRKIIVWVSPGWPLLAGSNIWLSTKQQQGIFEDIVSFSTLLLQARVTLYAVDPLGSGQSLHRGSYYKQFLKGVTKPNDVHPANLGLQVMVMQSGGVVHDFTNDIAGVLQKCVADAAPYYEISFEPPPAAHPDEYHQLEIKLAKPGLTARTRQGYYAQPSSHN